MSNRTGGGEVMQQQGMLLPRMLRSWCTSTTPGPFQRFQVTPPHTTIVLLLLVPPPNTPPPPHPHPPQVVIGCLPSYAQAGLASPTLLAIMRLIQGLAMGGEFGESHGLVLCRAVTHIFP